MRLKSQTTVRSCLNTKHQSRDLALESCCISLQTSHSTSTWFGISPHVHQSLRRRQYDSEAFGWLHGRPSRRVRFSEVETHSFWLAQRLRVRRASTGDFQWRWLGCWSDIAKISFWKCNFLWWMFDLLSSRTQKIVSLSSAESETYAAAPAVMDAILIRTILCWAWSALQIRILMYLFLDSSAAKGVLSRRCVGRLRHLSYRISQLSHFVFAGLGESETLQVKAVLGTINPADISTKRLSVARLESLVFLLGIWSCSSNQLVGSEGPGRIFRHLSSTSTSHTGRISQLQLLVSALSLLTVQLQGCSESVDAMSNDTPDVPFMFLATWLGLLGAYVFWLAQPSNSSRRVAENPNFEDGEDLCGWDWPDKQHVWCHK